MTMRVLFLPCIAYALICVVRILRRIKVLVLSFPSFLWIAPSQVHSSKKNAFGVHKPKQHACLLAFRGVWSGPITQDASWYTIPDVNICTKCWPGFSGCMIMPGLSRSSCRCTVRLPICFSAVVKAEMGVWGTLSFSKVSLNRMKQVKTTVARLSVQFKTSTTSTATISRKGTSW